MVNLQVCHWGQLLHTVFVFWGGGGNYFRQLLQETLQHNIPGGNKLL